MPYKNLITLAVSTLLCFAPAISKSANGPSAAKLLHDTIQAHGGQRALSCGSITLDVDATLVDPNGVRCDGRIIVKPRKFRLEYKLSPNHLYRMGYDGSDAWLIDAPGQKLAKKLDLVQEGIFKFYALVFSTGWLHQLQSSSAGVKYGGRETYNGAETEILQANVDIIGGVDYLIDTRTHLLKALRFNFPGEWQPSYEVAYDSYFNRDGVRTPGRISIFRDKKHYREYRIREARLCGEIPDSVFKADA